MVSPTLTLSISLILAQTQPTLPVLSSLTIFSSGVLTPNSVTINDAPLLIITISSPVVILPLFTHTEAITPRYGSKYESNIKAFVPSFSTLGLGILLITASIISITPSPVLALQHTISSSLKPKTLISSSLTLGTSALGKSILLITGIIFKSALSAK